MKKVEALIPAHQLDAVVDELRAHGLEEFVISEVMESSPGRERLYRGVKYAVDFGAEIKIETVVTTTSRCPRHSLSVQLRGARWTGSL